MASYVRFVGWFVLILLAACVGTEPLDETRNALVDQNIVEGDEPSPDIVALEFDFEPDARERTEIPLRVTNRWASPVDVDVMVLSSDGTEAPFARTVHRLRASPTQEHRFALSVDRLPLQLVGGSVNVLIVATHVGLDGRTRYSVTSPLWIEHAAGYSRAFVRSPRQELERNDTRGEQAVRDGLARRAGRVANARTDTLEFVDLTSGSSKGSEGRVTLSRPPAALLEAHASDEQFIEKVNGRVCVRALYFFTDSNQGEDFLKGNPPPFLGGLGLEPARFVYFGILKSDNTYLNMAHLDSLGCTPVWNMPAGNYTAYLMHTVTSGSKTIAVWDDHNHANWAVTQAFSVPSGGGTINLDINTLDARVNVLVMGSMAFTRQPAALPAAVTTHVHVNEDCGLSEDGGTPAFTACYEQEIRTIWLGTDTLGESKAFRKFNFLHELGHASMHQLIGGFASGTYNHNATTPNLCNCTHITISGSTTHCLQSREEIGAAQNEGFGHYFASDVLNVGTDANCTFAYYKEFRETNGSITPAPVPKSCLTQVRWLENQCLEATRGVEWDWLTFYWSLRNKGASPYTYANIGSVYTQSCGASCSEPENRFGALQSAANAVFGPGSPKALQWQNNGFSFGVNH